MIKIIDYQQDHMLSVYLTSYLSIVLSITSTDLIHFH